MANSLPTHQAIARKGKKKDPQALKFKNYWGEIIPAKTLTVYSWAKNDPVILTHPTTGTIWKYQHQAWIDRSIPGLNPDDCYSWLGSMHRQGYGMFNVRRDKDANGVNSGNMNAQRLVAAIRLGRPLLPSEFSYATCHCMTCTNPRHVKVGTRDDFIHNSPNKFKESSAYVVKYFVPENYLFITLNPAHKIGMRFGLTDNQGTHLKTLVRKKMKKSAAATTTTIVLKTKNP